MADVDAARQSAPLVGAAARGPVAITQEDQLRQCRENPADAGWNLSSAFRCKGRLSVAALRAAFEALVARHEALRTRFVDGAAGAEQVIDPPGRMRLPLVDLGDLPPKARQEWLVRVAMAEANRCFDLSSEQLLRVRLLRLGADEHVLLLIIHHIIVDVWSLSIFMGELGRLYSAFVEGKPAALPPLAARYVDYAVRERDYLRGERLDRLLDYWTARVTDAPVLELPTDYPRPAAPSTESATHSFDLPPELLEGLGDVGRGSRATLFMVLLAALNALLSRYSGATDIVVGTSAANRTRAEVQGVIGFFVTTLVLRTDLSGDPSCRELIARARDVAAGAYDHQQLPFSLLNRRLPWLRGIPFRVVLALNKMRAGTALQMTGVESIERLDLFGAPPLGVDLYFSMTQRGSALHVDLVYDPALFEPRTVDLMANDYVSILKEIAVDPEQRLSKLPCSAHAEPGRTA